MAIYHLHAKLIQRSKGKNVVGSAAYRHAARMVAEAEGEVFDYTKKRDVIHTEILLPKDAPAWLLEIAETSASMNAFSEKLWNLVEGIEKRKDAQLAREFEFALPIELSEAQNIALAREFIHDQFVLRGMVADFAIHWDAGNPHCHVLLSTRELTTEGFGQKVTAWNSKLLLNEWRAKWAEYANYHLKLHQYAVRIDHRSYEAQGIDLVPGIHEGKAIHDMERRGIPTEVMQVSNTIRAENFARIHKNPDVLLHKLGSQQETFTLAEAGEALRQYTAKDFLAAQKNLGQLEEKSPEKILSGEMLAQILAQLETHESVFTEKALAQALVSHVDNPEAFAKVLLEIKASPALIYLGAGDDGRDRFTTRRMFVIENELQQTADVLRNKRHHKIPAKKFQAILENYQQSTGRQLTEEQLHGVKHITGVQSIVCLVGRAGTGKSFSLGAAKAVWDAAGLQVFGVALSGIAADGLAREANIPSQTIEAFKYALREGRIKLHPNAVVVMDEAGMTDTHSMLAVVEAVEASGAKLALVGDPAQVQPVGPGASFRALLERLGFAEMNTVYRQKVEWQREATRLLSAGDVKTALALYDKNGLVYFDQTENDSLNRLVKDWLDSKSLVSERLVISHRNEDVDVLNQALRAARVQKQEIAEGHGVQTVRGKIQIAKDDRVLFLKNDKKLGVNNGRFATVASVEFTESGKVMGFTVKLDASGQEIRIDPRHYQHFAHGYAATVHKVQGMTVDEALVYAGGRGWNRHLTYVALSRHRHRCQLYAHQENYQQQAQFYQSLSRPGMKDSLLDFPLAFAERRGIDTGGLSRILPQHLAERLSRLTEQLRSRYRQWREPEDYQREQQEKLERFLKAEAQAKVREDARVVAAYVDARQGVGKAWQELSLQLEKLGLSKMATDAASYALISHTPAYQGLQNVLQERNALASKIMPEPERYQKALEIYGLDLNELQKQSDSHGCFARVQEYLRLEKQGRVVLRDRLALEIQNNIKAHYAYLKNQQADTRQLRQQAKGHERRQLMRQLTPEERESLRLVEAYRQKSSAVGAYYAEHIEPVKILSRDKAVYFEDLKNGRDRLACEILQKRELCAKSLDFYQTGSQEDTQQKRWYKLQAQAARHELRARVKNYLDACSANNMSERLRLAAEIRLENKAHYGAMRELGISPQAGLWLQLWQDEQRFKQWQYFKKLDLVERAAFLTVEAYVDAKRAHATAWRELFESKKAQQFDDSIFYHKLAGYGREYTKARDKLAAEIAGNALVYQASLEYFKINPEELNTQAYAHQCQSRIDKFIEAQAVIERAKMAAQIIADPKGHSKAMMEKKIDWRAIYGVARIAERQAVFKEASTEEKRLMRVWESYQKISRKMGKYYAQYKNQQNNHADKNRQNILSAMIAKRDALAYRVTRLKSYLETFELLAEQESNIKVKNMLEKNHKNTEKMMKLEKQAEAHVTRQKAVEVWQEDYAASLRQFGKIFEFNNKDEKNKQPPPEKLLRSLIDWNVDREDRGVAKMTQQIIVDGGCYQAALQEAGISLSKLRAQQEVTEKIKSRMEEWRSLAQTPAKATEKSALSFEDQRRIQIVRKIADESRPIKNTLAERYLREHRGIDCALHPKTFYYHPNLKNWMMGSQHPALVIVARDAEEQICGLQAIFLDAETGKKAALGNVTKLSRGLTSEGALIQQGKSGGKVAFAEGPETALSVAAAKPEWTVYCTFGVRNFDKVPLKTEAKEIIIAADNDGVRSGTEKAIEAAAQRLAERGKNVWVALPEKPAHIKKWDFNDALVNQGIAQVEKNLGEKKLIQCEISAERIATDVVQLAENLVDKKTHQGHLKPQENISETRLVDLHDMQTVLKHYVAQELEQTALTHARYGAKMQAVQEGMEASLKSLNHAKELTRLAVELTKHPEIQQEMAAMKGLKFKSSSLAERGGYAAIQVRFAEGNFDKADVQTVIKQIQHKAAKQSREQQMARERDRGGRSY